MQSQMQVLRRDCGLPKYCPQFEVDFLLPCAQNKRKLGESDIAKVVRGVGFEPRIFLDLSRTISSFLDLRNWRKKSAIN